MKSSSNHLAAWLLSFCLITGVHAAVIEEDKPCEHPLEGYFVLEFPFEPDSDTVTASDQVASLAQFLIESPIYSATLLGHSDRRGVDENNETLAERRANAAAYILAMLGVPTAQLTPVGCP